MWENDSIKKYIVCDRCGRKDVYDPYLPIGWHSLLCVDPKYHFQRKHFCPKCWGEIDVNEL